MSFLRPPGLAWSDFLLAFFVFLLIVPIFDGPHCLGSLRKLPYLVNRLFLPVTLELLRTEAGVCCSFPDFQNQGQYHVYILLIKYMFVE